jgi:hypothetical protein
MLFLNFIQVLVGLFTCAAFRLRRCWFFFLFTATVSGVCATYYRATTDTAGGKQNNRKYSEKLF